MNVNFEKSNFWYLLGYPYLKLASAHPDVDYKLMIRVDDEAHR